MTIYLIFMASMLALNIFLRTAALAARLHPRKVSAGADAFDVIFGVALLVWTIVLLVTY